MRGQHLLDTQQIQQVTHVAQDAANLLHLTGKLGRAVNQAVQQAHKIEEQLLVQEAQLSSEVCKLMVSTF